MGCSSHAFIQKKVDDKWETVLEDAVTLCSSECRELISDFSDNFTIGVPEDFETTTETSSFGDTVKHQGRYLGDHSFMFIGLKDFCQIPLEPAAIYDKMVLEKVSTGFYVSFEDPEEFGVKSSLMTLQEAFRIMFWDLENYRLVIGFDS